MKTHLLLLLALAGLSTACTPKNTPRYQHESKKEWTPIEGPRDESVEVSAMSNMDLTKAYAQLKTPGTDLKASVLLPLSRYVLNAKFTETPSNRTLKLAELVSVFNSAFMQQLYNKDQSPEFAKIKADYLKTVFSGCSRDLRRDCATADFFSTQPRHARIFTLLANEMDPQIEKAIAAAGSTSTCMEEGGACRPLIEERYYRLAMAAYNKRAHYDETEFQFSYLKYARLFSAFIEGDRNCRKGETSDACAERLKKAEQRNPETNSMSFSYLAQTHRQIFQTIIPKYDPKDYNNEEFKTFVKAFNPWKYSKKQGDVFQNAASTMFEFGTKCCLYEDTTRRKLSDDVKGAIKESMHATDHFVATAGLSFRDLITEIKKEHLDKKNPAKYDGKEYDLFKNLKIYELVRQIEREDDSFFNEYYFIVDRLFRGHLGIGEVEKVLRNSNQERAQAELPAMVTNYMKIYIAYMVVETNRFMAHIYNDNLASDKVFEEAVMRSRALTGRWQEIQQQLGLVRQLMGSYFNSLNLSDKQLKAYAEADKTIKAVNRNIHYLSVFPNMIVMTYNLTKANAPITFTSWWGQEFKLQGADVLKNLFAGKEPSPWFHFGVDPESVDRLMLLYSLEYLLSTEALNSFISKETNGEGKDRSAFFDLLFNKYLDDGVVELKNRISDYEAATKLNANLSKAEAMCAYEMGAGGGEPPKLTIDFMDLGKYTYSGMNDTSVAAVLNAYLGSAATGLKTLREELDTRRVYMKAMTEIIAQELLRTGKVQQKSDLSTHPDMIRGLNILKELDGLQARLAETFITNHSKFFKCATVLQEIERRRANRLYDEERAHLSHVFDLMKPLFSEGPEDRVAKRINDENFTAEKGYRFSRVVGRTYLMSKYDVLMRMKERVTNDIFRKPTTREVHSYGNYYSEYYRPRPVEVKVNEIGVERSEMVEKGTVAAVYMRGTSEADRADFIRQGLVTLNGRPGAFVEWQGKRGDDKGLDNYLTVASEFYLMGPIQSADGKILEVTKLDLVEAYLKSTASYSLDALDQQNARDFGIEGRYPKTFYLDRLFQRDGQTPEPLFYYLTNQMNKMAVLTLKNDGPVKEALDFAKGFNSMQAFVFKPSDAVRESVISLYGERAHTRMQRMADLYSYIEDIEDKFEDAEKLDPRLTQPFYIENGIAYSWYRKGERNMKDPNKLSDLRILVDQFTQQTNKIYGTEGKVKVP